MEKRLVPVSNATELNNALATVPDGGIIELANGTYTPPSSTGFLINEPNKEFTIRAQNPGGATIDVDQGMKPVTLF